MFSQTVEYALRAMVFLSTESPTAVTTGQIAEGTKVPLAYLSKVLQSLSRSNLVHSQRGVKGGMSLIREPSEISLLEVVNAVDPIERIETCPLGIERHGTKLCPLHKRMDKALADVESNFADTTLEDLINQPGESFPLCEVPKIKSSIQLSPPSSISPSSTLTSTPAPSSTPAPTPAPTSASTPTAPPSETNE